MSHVAFRLGLVRFGWASSGGLVRVCSGALGYDKVCFGGLVPAGSVKLRCVEDGQFC